MKFIRNEIRESALSRGLFIASGAVSPVEIAAECGFDWLLLDMEHGLGDEHATLQQITALKHSNTAPIVRIPTLAEATIKRILDFGASGIMAPMIESREEAERLVRAMRYPPEGIRGLSSGSRAADYGFDFKEYFRRANRELLCIAQIEAKRRCGTSTPSHRSRESMCFSSAIPISPSGSDVTTSLTPKPCGPRKKPSSKPPGNTGKPQACS